MLITKEFEIEIKSEYAHAEEEILSEPEKKTSCDGTLYERCTQRIQKRKLP